jgi:hypothetical protein
MTHGTNKGDIQGQQKRYKIKAKVDNRFHCVFCCKSFGDKNYLTKHKDNKKHIKNFIYY